MFFLPIFWNRGRPGPTLTCALKHIIADTRCTKYHFEKHDLPMKILPQPNTL